MLNIAYLARSAPLSRKVQGKRHLNQAIAYNFTKYLPIFTNSFTSKHNEKSVVKHNQDTLNV